MRLSRSDVEAQVPPRGTGRPGSLPQIRRQLERVCEATGLEYDDLVELQIRPGILNAILYARNENGERYREEDGTIAVQGVKIPVDTTTFLGDERDI